MTRQQLKAARQFNQAKETYIEYAHAQRGRVSNEHKTAKALEVAGNNLIVAFYGDDPLWLGHGMRSGALRQAALLAGVDIWVQS